jgi:PAS domain S-box-containing protein
MAEERLRARILMVDDSRTERAYFREILEAEGYEVFEARDGLSCLEELPAVRPELILLDVVMPGIDGYETCRRIKAEQRWRDIPVIFISALDEGLDKSLAFEAGAADYVTKPIDLAELRARIQTQLVASEARMQGLALTHSLERGISEKTAELQTLIDTLPDLVWMKSAPRDRIIGRTDFDFLDAQLAESFRTRDRKAIEAGSPIMNEEEMVFASDGHHELLETIKTPIFASDGSVLAVLGIGRDITERKRIEEALRKSEEKYRTIVEDAPVGILQRNLATGFTITNPCLWRQFGCASEAEFLSRYGEVSQRWLDEDRYADFLSRLKDEGRVEGFEHGTRLADGSTKWFSLFGRLSADGSTLDGFTVDITDRRIAEDRLRQSLAEKDSLIRELYHRTKNSLQLISAMVSLQARAGPPAGEGETRLRELSRTIESRIQAIALVHEMLYESRDLSRISMRKYVGELVSMIRNSYDVPVERIDIELEVEDLSFLIDTAVPLGIMLNELITNSLKYAFPGGRKGRIAIGMARVEPGLYALHYEDDGVGLPEGFDCRKQGSLGLQLLYSIGEGQMNGRLDMDGRAGLRADFSFHDDLYEARV